MGFPETIEFGREVLASADESLQREWLETNGIGGFAGPVQSGGDPDTESNGYPTPGRTGSPPTTAPREPSRPRRTARRYWPHGEPRAPARPDR